MTKRAERRERRRRQKVRRQIITVITIGAVVLVIAMIALNANSRPVGDIVQITPRARSMVAGDAMGDPNAPVLIEVFEDFQCPACKDYTDRVEPLIEEEYVATGEVYYVFRHYPFLDDRVATSESDHAAVASLCASEQEAFWDYHDMLFANWDGENAGSFNDRRLIAFAETLGLDVDAFSACFNSDRYIDQINQDFTDGGVMGVTGTPSVFVNGVQITPGFVPSFEDVSRAVEAALEQDGS
jgi:protein-disulfide isomerase